MLQLHSVIIEIYESSTGGKFITSENRYLNSFELRNQNRLKLANVHIFVQVANLKYKYEEEIGKTLQELQKLPYKCRGKSS